MLFRHRLFVAVIFTLAAAAPADGQAVNFDTPGELSANFVQNGSTGNFVQVPDGGITGGAVDVVKNFHSDTAVYKTPVPSGIGQTVSTSVFFRYSRAIREYSVDGFPIRVGFTTSTTPQTASNSPYVGADAGAFIYAPASAFFGGKLFVICVTDEKSQAATELFDELLDGHWYRFTLDVTITGNSGQLNYKTFLQSFGVDGKTPAASRIGGSATIASAKVTAASQLYAGFHARRDGGTDLLDNFSVMNGATPPQGADVGVKLASNKDPGFIGDDIIYTATVTNSGPEDSTDVRLKVDLPIGVTFKSVSCDSACSSTKENQSILVDLGTVPAGSTRRVQVTVRPDSNGSYTVNATASSSTSDENTKNNTTSLNIAVLASRPRQLLNIATRLRVQTGENVLIGGFIVTGNDRKKIIIRAIGPSLSEVASLALQDTTLELYQGDTLLATNDNWKDSQRQEIEETTIPPSDDRESAIVYTVDPGSYTAVMSGKGGATGIGVIEVYDLDQAANSKLVNIASRGFVEAGDSAMIGGLIVGGNGTVDARILLRAIGPSLGDAGIAGALRDPVMQLLDANGALIRENDDWRDTQQAEIEATTIQPSNAAESAIVTNITSGNYTAIVRGKDGGLGVGLVEVYSLR